MEALEFHHIDKSKKEFTLANIGVKKGLRGWENIVKEAKKCILVCSNCHKGIEAKKIEIPIDAPNFDLSLIPKIKEKEKKYCYCGKETKAWKKYCSMYCSSMARRIVERPPMEKIVEMVEKDGYSATGRKYGVSGITIKRWIMGTHGRTKIK